MLAGLRVLWHKARGLCGRPAPDDAFADEIREHVALLMERYIQQGLSPADADAAARRQFGNRTILLEGRTEMRTFAALENFAHDLRFGARVLSRTPGFTVVAFLTLALGIGANAAIFSMVEALLLRPLPYPDASRLVVPATIFQRSNSDTGSSAFSDIEDWKAQTDLFEAVSAYSQSELDLSGGGEPERIRGVAADEDYFRVMGSPLLLGRGPTVEEHKVGNHRVAVLSYNFWQRRFGGDAGVVGSTLELMGLPFHVIGVARQDATWPANAELFRPLALERNADLLRRDNHMFRAVARLRRGVSIEQAQAKLTAMGGRIAQQNVNRSTTNWKLHSLGNFLIGPTLRQTLAVLFGASLLVLLIACVNVANLLLARGAARSREVAIRGALGAGWKRIAVQFLAESATLAAAGGVAGVALGYWGLKMLIRFAPAGVPRLDEARIDPGVLAFTAFLCLLAAVVAGAGPAIQAARRSPAALLHETSRGSSGGVRSGRARNLLVVSELSLAVILLAAAGLLIRSFQQIQRVDPGFTSKNLLTLRISLPSSRYPGAAQSSAGFDRIAEAIRRIPGVTGASGIGSLPVEGGGFYLGRVFLRDGQPEPPNSADAAALWTPVLPGLFETAGVRILAGRSFTPHDAKDAAPVIIISQRMAKEMFPAKDPIGQRIRSWRDENLYREIVGVAADVHFDTLTEDLGNTVYVPYAQNSWGVLMMCVRTDSDPRALLPSIRGAIWSVDRKLSVSAVQTMDEIIAAGLARTRFSMFLLATFGATALLLAAIGIYGVVAFSVTQRTREIGIRIALGAERTDVLQMVARGALQLAAAGIVCGVAGGLALTRLMSTLLFGVSPSDARTFVMVGALLLVVTLAAALIPARRAARVDPTVTLRYE